MKLKVMAPPDGIGFCLCTEDGVILPNQMSASILFEARNGHRKLRVDFWIGRDVELALDQKAQPLNIAGKDS